VQFFISTNISALAEIRSALIRPFMCEIWKEVKNNA
jgi:hypothetical protein